MPKTSKKASSVVQDCPICMVRPTNCQTVQCSHNFCYRCLSKWGRVTLQLTQRQGNCPLCRADFRKILYKKKVIQPQYLKEFDAVSESPLQPPPRPPPAVRRPIPPMIMMPPLLFYGPQYAHYGMGMSMPPFQVPFNFPMGLFMSRPASQ